MLTRSWLVMLLFMGSVVLFTGCSGSEDEEGGEEPVPVEDAGGGEQMDNMQQEGNAQGMDNQVSQEGGQPAYDDNAEPPTDNVANAAQGNMGGNEMAGNTGEGNAAAASASSEFDTTPCYFAFDDYSLTETAQAKLKEKVDQLKGKEDTKILVEGHCDERGSNQYNLALGERRAHSVKMFLVNNGVAADRISIISYGEEKASDPGHSEESWAKNRRTEFVVK